MGFPSVTDKWRNVQANAPYEWHQALLSTIAELLEPSAGDTMQHIAHARIPVVKFRHSWSGVECDICICNREGVYKSEVFREISRLDHRFPDLVRLVRIHNSLSSAARPLPGLDHPASQVRNQSEVHVHMAVCTAATRAAQASAGPSSPCMQVKAWARCQRLNDPVNGSFNSYALTLMALFHLQSVQPPVMPSVAHIMFDERPIEGGVLVLDDTNAHIVPVDDVRQHCRQLGSEGFGLDNKSSVAELFLGFIVRFMAITQAWASGRARNVRVSTFEGMMQDAFFDEDYIMLMEDPFDWTDNSARTIGRWSGGRGCLNDVVRAFRAATEPVMSLEDTDCVADLMIDLFGRREAGYLDFKNMSLFKGGATSSDASAAKHANGGAKPPAAQQPEPAQNSAGALRTDSSNGNGAARFNDEASTAPALRGQGLRTPPVLNSNNGARKLARAQAREQSGHSNGSGPAIAHIKQRAAIAAGATAGPSQRTSRGEVKAAQANKRSPVVAAAREGNADTSRQARNHAPAPTHFSEPGSQPTASRHSPDAATQAANRAVLAEAREEQAADADAARRRRRRKDKLSRDSRPQDGDLQQTAPIDRSGRLRRRSKHKQVEATAETQAWQEFADSLSVQPAAARSRKRRKKKSNRLQGVRCMHDWEPARGLDRNCGLLSVGHFAARPACLVAVLARCNKHGAAVSVRAAALQQKTSCQRHRLLHSKGGSQGLLR